MAADCKSAAPCELRRFESSPVHQVSVTEAARRPVGFAVNRFAVAMLAYAVLAALAATTLTDVKVRGVTLAILAMFAVRTWVQHRKQQLEAPHDE
jgi:xanthine/uracil/vitamin C permease (AzgA family)